MNNKWTDPDKISLDEIPFSAIVLNRFDIVIPFRDTSTRQEDWEYADAKSSYDERRIKHNYNFLRKLIEYVKTIDPTITEQAKGLLNNFYVEIKQQNNFASNPRTLETIFRISKAIARMNLSFIVDEKIAIDTIEFINQMLGEFHSAIYLILDPFMKSYEETIKVIQHTKASIDLIEAVKIACGRGEQVKAYIGRIFEQDRNKKLRNLCTRILENNHVVRIREHPTVVVWKDEVQGVNDLNALGNQPAIEKIKKAESKISQKVVKITRNTPQNAHEKNNFEVGERKDRSLRSLRASSSNISQEEFSNQYEKYVRE